MTLPAAALQRLSFLTRVAGKEARHLAGTTERLFSAPLTPERVSALEQTPDLAERIDAFVTRFSRLQDTLGDKLLPLLLTALGEKTAAMIDNLDRAEQLRLIPSADQWMEMRRLRNQMAHDYVEDPLVLANALETACQYVPVLLDVAGRVTTEMQRRGCGSKESPGIDSVPLTDDRTRATVGHIRTPTRVFPPTRQINGIYDEFVA